MKKLIEYSDSDLIELKLTLIAGAKNYFGISNLPDEYDLKIMCEFLMTHFKDFTAHEINRAMSMYANGQISVHNQIYGVLNMKFLSDVLHEYRLQRKIWNDFEKRRQDEKKMLSAPAVNHEEKNRNLYLFLVNHVEQTNQIPELFAWDEVYAHLEKEKIIELSNEDKIDFLNLMKEEIRESITYFSNVHDKKNDVKELMKLLSNEKSLASFCRKKLVLLHLNNLTNKQPTNGTNE